MNHAFSAKRQASKIERDAVLPAYSADLARIFHRYGLAAAGVVGHGEHDERDALAADASDEGFERGNIHVSLEGIVQGRLATFGDEQINGFGSDEFDIGAGRVEVSVVGNDVALFAGDAEENALGGAALVRGNDVLVADNVLDGVAETIVAAAAGVALVAFHDGGPLVSRHRPGAGVGEQIDEHIIGVQEEQVVMRGFQQLFALGAGCPANWLDALDPKGLDDGSYGHDFVLSVMRHMKFGVTYLLSNAHRRS